MTYVTRDRRSHLHGISRDSTRLKPATACSIEARLGKPVVTSNQSTIWASLRVLGLTQPVMGFGRLLEGLAAAPTAA
ncbi:MAG TPA: hypothetical protein VHQ69_06855 [Methylomirabilota bacterium]|nr:hypothetical protein [Methylomirabilota bacterium]